MAMDQPPLHFTWMLPILSVANSSKCNLYTGMNEYHWFNINLNLWHSSMYVVNEDHIFNLKLNQINAKIFKIYQNYIFTMTNLFFLKILYCCCKSMAALHSLCSWTLCLLDTLVITVTWFSHSSESLNCLSFTIIKITSRKVTSIIKKFLKLSSEPLRGAELRPYILLESFCSRYINLKFLSLESTSIIKPHLFKGDLGPIIGAGSL